MTQTPAIILASQSAARIDMLKRAGLNVQSQPANVDETAIIQNLLEKEETFDEIAIALAEAKAKAISAQNTGALVIGADQILEFNGEIFEKAKTKDEAITRLRAMCGQTHHLISAITIALNGEIIWETCDHAALSMHAHLDEAFFNHYRAHAGEALTKSVGGYWLEDIGSWLFESIEGNYFTILGMPLLPLLAYLHDDHEVLFKVPS